MNEQIVSALSKTLNIDLNVSELTDEQQTELIDKISTLKVFTDESLKDRDSNIRKDFRTTIEKEVSGKTLEKFEKDFKQKFGVDLKHGEDYQSALELAEKVLTKKVSESSNDEELKKELDSLRSKIKAINEEKDQAINELTSKFTREKTDMILNSEISKFKNILDVSDELKDGQLEFIKYNFDKKYELREQDGQMIVFDKSKQEIVKNQTDYSYESLSNVLEQIAPTLVKFKTTEPKKGRANEIINEPVTDAVVAKFKTLEDFNKYLTDKRISQASNEGIRLYAAFKKSQGEPVNL